jgi:endonuclease-3
VNGKSRKAALLRRRSAAVLRELHKACPTAHVELTYSSPFELLVATILSAQCTDARVNQVTPRLFRAYPTPLALADADPAVLEELIRSTGFFRSKARSLVLCSQSLVERYEGQVPADMEELRTLPGVGRKTANVILGAAYGIPAGIVVDTHMARLAHRLGLSRQTDPVRIERDLLGLVPKRERIFFSIAMVLHGRYVCKARTPRCHDCAIRAHCPSRDRLAASPPRPPRDRDRG